MMPGRRHDVRRASTPSENPQHGSTYSLQSTWAAIGPPSIQVLYIEAEPTFKMLKISVRNRHRDQKAVGGMNAKLYASLPGRCNRFL
jgi:hypothetical protein